ncbi:hypothetical protein DFH07DRAFT_949946 [Mycena maculata]|uniref:F-box domain-containing protein n=1 Tax=Mycena maculata TaxID=230809 RepID=A0AAD7KAQ4_9AGAR|nr:hypothetical protein DFH07DRAFT_949946 [Mycena maculata]
MFFADSPFTDKLNTSHVPAEPEILRICALLVAPTEELARIEVQINEPKTKQSLRTAIDAHKTLISHMRLAPQDVFQEIFLACLPTAHGAVIEAPMLLGHICRYWRSVAYSTPESWSYSTLHDPQVTSQVAEAGSRLIPPSID